MADRYGHDLAGNYTDYDSQSGDDSGCEFVFVILYSLYFDHICRAGYTDGYTGGDDSQISCRQQFHLDGGLDGFIKEAEDFLFLLDHKRYDAPCQR